MFGDFCIHAPCAIGVGRDARAFAWIDGGVSFFDEHVGLFFFDMDGDVALDIADMAIGCFDIKGMIES